MNRTIRKILGRFTQGSGKGKLASRAALMLKLRAHAHAHAETTRFFIGSTRSLVGSS